MVGVVIGHMTNVHVVSVLVLQHCIASFQSPGAPPPQSSISTGSLQAPVMVAGGNGGVVDEDEHGGCGHKRPPPVTNQIMSYCLL